MANTTQESVTFSGKTAFSNITRFLAIGEDRLIETRSFLDACSGVVSVLDKLGSAFSVPKKDVVGNIKKINECFQKSPDQCKTLNMFIETKQATGAVLWLKRALEFLLAFIDSIVHDHKNGTEQENLRQNVVQAYELTLKHYHGKMTQFVFSNIARLVPHRSAFLKALMTQPDATFDMVFTDLTLYLPDFRDNISVVDEMLVAHDLEKKFD